MLDATQQFASPLTQERLFGWHTALFPTGYGGIHPIRIGNWRDDSKGAMQVISGPISREKVHFEAPAAKRLQHEMDAFFAWVNNAKRASGDEVIDPVLKAAVAHLWFVTIHPFDDGNGRIARAIADWALARSEGSSQRFYSMSSQITGQSEARDVYRDMLERAQKSTLDITDWVEWFLACLDRAITATETTLGAVFRKATLWDKWDKNAGGTINERQKKCSTNSSMGLKAADINQMGDHCQVLAGHGATRHSEPHQSGHPGQRLGGRAEYELLLG